LIKIVIGFYLSSSWQQESDWPNSRNVSGRAGQKQNRQPGQYNNYCQKGEGKSRGPDWFAHGELLSVVRAGDGRLVTLYHKGPHSSSATQHENLEQTNRFRSSAWTLTPLSNDAITEDSLASNVDDAQFRQFITFPLPLHNSFTILRDTGIRQPIKSHSMFKEMRYEEDHAANLVLRLYHFDGAIGLVVAGPGHLALPR
jgi:hypothetical protein